MPFDFAKPLHHNEGEDGDSEWLFPCREIEDFICSGWLLTVCLNKKIPLKIRIFTM